MCLNWKKKPTTFPEYCTYIQYTVYNNLQWNWQVHSTRISWNRYCQRRCWWAFEAANQLWPPQSSRRGLAETLNTQSQASVAHIWMHDCKDGSVPYRHETFTISCTASCKLASHQWVLDVLFNSKETMYTCPYHCTFFLISSRSQLELSDDDW